MRPQTDPTHTDQGPADSRPAAPRIPGYRYERRLGQGGYAVVHLYKDEQLGRNVAVKVLSTLDAAARRQFESEMRILSGFNDPYIVPLVQPGESDDGRPYFLMPYCSGGSLATAVGPDKPPMPVERVVEIGVRIAAALTAVHGRHIVHRDVKPSNILLDDEGRPRLSDFGTAGPLAEADPLAARDDFAVSVAWSPAEMLAGAHGSIASDVYSLGATLWHLLAGRSPFEIPGGDNTAEALERRIKAGKLQPLRRPEVPQRLDSLLHTMLSHDPKRRPKSARDVGATLADLLGAMESDSVASSHRRGLVAEKTEHRPNGPKAPSGFPEVGANWGDADSADRGPSPDDGDAKRGSRRRKSALAGAVAVIAIVAATAISTLSQGGAGAASSPDAAASGALSATQGPQDPGVLGENEPPGAPTVTAHRTSAGTVVFAWTYSAELSSDTYLWRTTDGKSSGTTKSASLTLSDPGGTQLCVQVKVVRANGGDASVDWSTAGCGS